MLDNELSNKNEEQQREKYLANTNSTLCLSPCVPTSRDQATESREHSF